MSHVLVHACRIFFVKYLIRTTKRETNVGRVWMGAAGQRHISVHVRTDAADGAATRHAGADEDQEEELAYGKCLVAHLLARLMLLAGRRDEGALRLQT